jgi:hypothetical protein
VKFCGVFKNALPVLDKNFITSKILLFNVFIVQVTAKTLKKIDINI